MMSAGDRTLVIVGAAAAGLFVVRQAASFDGRLHMIGRGGEIGLASRWGTKHSVENVNQLEDAVRSIERAAGGRRLLGILTSDYFITALLESAPEIFDRIDWIGPDRDLLARFNDKGATYALASTRGVQVPRTLRLSEWTEASTDAATWIVKWAETDLEFAVGSSYRKTWTASSVAAVTELKRSLPESTHAKLIVQPYLSEAEHVQLSYGGFFRGGAELAGIIVRQFRQYPQGVSSYVEEISGAVAERVANSARELIRGDDYTGFLEAEFRYHPGRGDLVLLDVNPRPWGWIGALGAKYPELGNVFSGGMPGSPIRKQVRWVNLARDAQSIVRTCRGDRSLRPVIDGVAAWGRANTIDILDRSDPQPFFRGLRLFAKRVISIRRKA